MIQTWVNETDGLRKLLGFRIDDYYFELSQGPLFATINDTLHTGFLVTLQIYDHSTYWSELIHIMELHKMVKPPFFVQDQNEYFVTYAVFIPTATTLRWQVDTPINVLHAPGSEDVPVYNS